MKDKKLLEAALFAMNALPNTRINHPEFKNTYELASALGKTLRDQPAAPAGNDPQRLPLCQCNKCNIVLIDKNPQTDAPEYALKGDEKEMVFIEENCFWACPICKTDGNLQDNITIADYSPPAGNDLPQQLSYEGNGKETYDLILGGRIIAELHTGEDEAIEICKAFNDFPALQECNRQLVEALKRAELFLKNCTETDRSHDIFDEIAEALEASK